MASRGDAPPTAAELRGRATVADPASASGRFRCEGGFRATFSWSGDRPYTMGLAGEVAFRYEGPGRWWVTDADGLVRGVDGARAVVRHHEQGLVSMSADRLRIGIGPERFLRPEPLPDDDADPIETDWQGRRAWRVGAVVVDDETGVVLREEQGESWAEILDLEMPCAAGTFDLPDAPPWQPPPPDHHHPGSDRAAWGDRLVPSVTWTPMGLPRTPLDGDVGTGWLVQQLRVCTNGGAFFLRLHRRPDGVDAPLPDNGHHWHADGCDWLLAVGPTDDGVNPPAAAELRAMAASVDTATPWPA